MDIGENTIIQDNVILGTSEEGEIKIGDNSIIRSGTIIYSNVKTGKNFRTGHNVLIRENTFLGDNVLVGTNSVIDGECRIGSNVNIQTGVYITKYTLVEDDVFFGPFSVTTNDKRMECGAKLKGPIFKKNSKVGANSTILPGVVVGEEAIIGAGAIVTKNVSKGDVVAGSSARSLKKRRV